MTVLVVGSVRGGPGVTTTSLLLAGFLPDGAVAEADLDGGALAVRYGLGREPGLTTLAAARPTAAGGWRRHAQDAGGVPVLVGPDAPDRMSSLWSRAGAPLTEALAAADATVVVDTGRLRPGGPVDGLLAGAALTLVLVQPVPEHLVTLAHRLPALRAVTNDVALVLAGGGRYGPDEVREQFGLDVFGTLPHDGRTAALLAEGGGSARRLGRTPLARAARSLAAAVTDRFRPAGSEVPGDPPSGREQTEEVTA